MTSHPSISKSMTEQREKKEVGGRKGKHTHPESALTKGGLGLHLAEPVRRTNAQATATKRSRQRLNISAASACSQPLHRPAFHSPTMGAAPLRGGTPADTHAGWRGERRRRPKGKLPHAHHRPAFVSDASARWQKDFQIPA